MHIDEFDSCHAVAWLGVVARVLEPDLIPRLKTDIRAKHAGACFPLDAIFEKTL